MWYYMNVSNLQYLLEPLFKEMEKDGYWPRKFALHDIGSHFPGATGRSDGITEDMPVEETANMLLMVADIVFHPKTRPKTAEDYVRKHYKVMTQWVEYLFENCLYPSYQFTTDNFVGRTRTNSGLALKGILAMKAFSKMAHLIGKSYEYKNYDVVASVWVKKWVQESMHASGTHLKREYYVPEGYQLQYNAFQDKLLNLDTVPREIYSKEAAYYLTKMKTYGIPLVSTHDYTKSDWEMWTAAAFGDANPTLRRRIIAAMGKYLRETPNRVPFSDWYSTANGRRVGFQARPVVGGHFALLARNVE